MKVFNTNKFNIAIINFEKDSKVKKFESVKTWATSWFLICLLGLHYCHSTCMPILAQTFSLLLSLSSFLLSLVS